MISRVFTFSLLTKTRPRTHRLFQHPTFKMSATGALHTSASLKAAGAPQYSSMQGKLDPQLLEALREMKFDFMTPVQEQVLGGMPSLGSDW